MAGILVQLALSWLLIWLIERKNLSVLGLWPNRRRAVYFVLFFGVTACICAADFFLRMGIVKQRWQLNPDLSFAALAEGIAWNIKSVLFEELIFRGVLLYILIKRTGRWNAILLSSVAFGIYHWFSFEVIGNPLQMLIIFLSTGLMGIVYAYGYARSFSLYVPIAIHLGWNLVRSVVFSETIIGKQLLIPAEPVQEVTISWFAFFVVIYLPLLSAICINFWLIRRLPQSEN